MWISLKVYARKKVPQIDKVDVIATEIFYKNKVLTVVVLGSRSINGVRNCDRTNKLKTS